MGYIGADPALNESVTSAQIADDAITLAKMASGTDGAMLTYDASGNPVAITGTDGQVATSAGADAVSAFEAAAGGDVSKVGTPANNEVGIWTGDGTIEGDSDLTYDGTTLTVSGEVDGLYNALVLKNTYGGGSGQTRLEFRTEDENDSDDTRACFVVEDDGANSGKIAIQTRDGSGNVEDRMVIDKDGKFSMGSDSQFLEVKKALAENAAAHPTYHSVHTVGSTEDGIWMVLHLGSGGNTFQVNWFSSCDEGAARATNRVAGDSAAGQWSANDIQIYHGASGTQDLYYQIYKLAPHPNQLQN